MLTNPLMIVQINYNFSQQSREQRLKKSGERKNWKRTNCHLNLDTLSRQT